MSLIRPAPTEWRGTARQLGPGLIISATIVGSGELIVTTRLGSETGFTLLWFIIFGCLIKVFLQIEIGRYAITHGQTSLQALNGMPGPRWIVSWLVWVWIVMFVATFFQVAGMLGGVAGIFQFAGLGANWRSWVWPLIISVITAGLLAVGRYRLIERFSSVMVALFTVFTIAAVLALQWTEYRIQFSDLVEGFSFKLPDNFTTAFMAFGIIGVGASELIYYPYWCLEKGYAAFTGPNDGSPEWRERARGWLRVLRVDAWVSMVIYTLATIAFYLLGAAVLNRKGLVVDNQEMVPTLSHMYRETFGEVGYWGYICGAVVVLYSTVFLATASNGRLFADLCGLFRWVKIRDDEHRAWLVKAACVGLTVVYFVLFTNLKAPVTLVLVGALAQAMMLPFLGAAALYFLYRKTEPALKPGRLWVTFLWVSGLLMALMGGYQLWSTVTEMLKKHG
jgi:manganese transport protein